MAVKTIAERLYEAYLSGTEAIFYSDGITYTFTPEGLQAFISSEAVPVTWGDIEDKPENAFLPDTNGVTPDYVPKVQPDGTVEWASENLTNDQREAIDLLVSPTVDYGDLTEVTAAIKSVIDALKA